VVPAGEQLSPEVARRWEEVRQMCRDEFGMS
jgi:hypothetical protein